MGLSRPPSYGGDAEAQGRSDGAQAPQLGGGPGSSPDGSALQSEFWSLGDEPNQQSVHRHPEDPLRGPTWTSYVTERMSVKRQVGMEPTGNK